MNAEITAGNYLHMAGNHPDGGERGSLDRVPRDLVYVCMHCGEIFEIGTSDQQTGFDCEGNYYKKDICSACRRNRLDVVVRSSAKRISEKYQGGE